MSAAELLTIEATTLFGWVCRWGTGVVGDRTKAVRLNLPTCVLAGRVTVQRDARTRSVAGTQALRDSAHSRYDSMQRAAALQKAAAAAATDHLHPSQEATDAPRLR
jgi:hypothetical protein